MTRTTTFPPTPFPAPVGRRLTGALAALHEDVPFGPGDVRGAARRVVDTAGGLGLDAVIVRGEVDVGGAGVDHVFVVVEDRVVDVSLPVKARSFVRAVRAWVAGDIDREELDALAVLHPFDRRVVGEFGAPLRYRGAPLWGSDG